MMKIMKMMKTIFQIKERKGPMMSIEKVRLEWNKNLFSKTILDRVFWHAKQSSLRSPPRIWKPGEIYFTLIKQSTHWKLGRVAGIGKIMDTISKEIERRANWARYYNRKIPDRGLADCFSYWVIDLMKDNYRSSLDLMLSLSLLLGSIAFWELAPQLLLEVEPTLILNPEKIILLKKVIMHDGCHLNEICMCTQDPVNKKVAEDFQQLSSHTTEVERVKGRSAALAMLTTSILIGIMLNTVSTSHIMN